MLLKEAINAAKSENDKMEMTSEFSSQRSEMKDIIEDIDMELHQEYQEIVLQKIESSMKEMMKQQRMLGITPTNDKKEELKSKLNRQRTMSKTFENKKEASKKKEKKDSTPFFSLYQDSIVISTNTSYYRTWAVLLILMTIFQSCFYMFCAGFRYDLEFLSYDEYEHLHIGHKFSRKDVYILNVIHEFIEGYFFVHILL